jgi:DNA polymerase-3 subunit delta
MAGNSSAADTEALLASARRKPAPVYLLIGEPYETETAARALIDVLVPRQRRSFNLETYDGRNAAIGPILDSLRTPGLFGGTKVVWVREPALFLSGEKRSDAAAELFAAWSEERSAEAAERLLALAALAGWTQERFAATDWRSLSATEAAALFGRTITAAERDAAGAIAAFCAERQAAVGAQRDESGLVEEFLAAGVPPGNVLLFTAAAVDRRKRLVKVLREAGIVAEYAVQRERNGALSAASVEEIIDRVASAHGVKVAPAARRAIVQRAGRDQAQLAMELEKLCLYAADRDLVTEEDVRASVRDLAESWIFDFTRALAQRRAVPAIALLRALFTQGEHPLRLLALIAREVRLLLLARDCLADTLAGAWTPGVQYDVFRDRLLPRLGQTQREAFGNIHPYALYQCLQNAGGTSTAALQRAVLALQQLDVRFKSSSGDPKLLLESFVLDMCRPTAPR